MKLPVCDFAKVKSGGATVVVGSVVELLPLLAVASFPPETLALFVTDDAAFEATLTLKVKTLLPLVVIAVELMHVITLLAGLQLQLAELVPPKVKAPFETLKPVGKVSVTVIVPEVAAVPEFPIVNV